MVLGGVLAGDGGLQVLDRKEELVGVHLIRVVDQISELVLLVHLWLIKYQLMDLLFNSIYRLPRLSDAFNDVAQVLLFLALLQRKQLTFNLHLQRIKLPATRFIITRKN